MSGYLILIGIILVFGVFVYIQGQTYKKKLNNTQKEIDSLIQLNHEQGEALKKKERLITSMKDHQSRINLTEKELKPIKKKVKEAKSEKDVLAAIDLVLKRNLQRMPNDKD